jgi:hypothetical protein
LHLVVWEFVNRPSAPDQRGVPHSVVNPDHRHYGTANPQPHEVATLERHAVTLSNPYRGFMRNKSTPPPDKLQRFGRKRLHFVFRRYVDKPFAPHQSIVLGVTMHPCDRHHRTARPKLHAVPSLEVHSRPLFDGITTKHIHSGRSGDREETDPSHIPQQRRTIKSPPNQAGCRASRRWAKLYGLVELELCERPMPKPRPAASRPAVIHKAAVLDRSVEPDPDGTGGL